LLLGEFETDASDPWNYERAPETGGGPVRTVIKFRLLPSAEFSEGGQTRARGKLPPTLQTPYTPANEELADEKRKPLGVAITR
jgi:hypothetical protein